MTISSPITPAPEQLSGAFLRRLCAAIMLCIAADTIAQPVLLSEPAVLLAPRAVRETTPTDSPLAPNYSEAVSGTPITFGEFRIFPQLYTSYLHATGLPSGQGINVDTDIFTVSPGLTAEIGQHWILNYTPTWINYSSASMRDSVNHEFKLDGVASIEAWTLKLAQSYQSGTSILAETGEQTKQHTWNTVLSAARTLGTHSTYEALASLDERFADKSPDTRTWSTEHWLKTQVSPKVNAGVGLNLGYVDIARQPNMKYERYLGQMTWTPTAKLTLSAEGGLEDRHSEAAGTEALRSPNLQISLGYQPFDHTRLVLTDFRNVTNSYFDDTLTKNKGWSASLNQRLLEKLQLSITYNRQTSDYSTFGGAAGPTSPVLGRSDDINSFTSNLSIRLFQYWTLAAVYQRTKDASEKAGVALADFSFSTTQYGLELSGRF